MKPKQKLTACGTARRASCARVVVASTSSYNPLLLFITFPLPSTTSHTSRCRHCRDYSPRIFVDYFFHDSLCHVRNAAFGRGPGVAWLLPGDLVFRLRALRVVRAAVLGLARLIGQRPASRRVRDVQRGQFNLPVVRDTPSCLGGARANGLLDCSAAVLPSIVCIQISRRWQPRRCNGGS